MDPGLAGPELLAGPPLARFCRCVPARCLGQTRVLAVTSKSRYTIIDTTWPHRNGKHLRSPSLGSEEEHDKESYDPEEEAKLMNVEAKNQHKMDAPDVIEMTREDENIMKGVPDYAAGLMSAASSWSSSASGSAEERQFGDSSSNHESMACEER